jgi:hypothetical protein
MDIVTKIKRLFSKTDKSEKSASVTFYPNQTIISTYNFATTGIGLASTKLTKLEIDTSPDVIGQTLRKHLALTEYDVEHPNSSEAFKKVWIDYKLAAGFKTNKETYKDAREIGCRMSKTEITLMPCENQYSKGYFPIPNSEIKLPLTISDTELGQHLLKAREIATG